jgi:hypothetical protein
MRAEGTGVALDPSDATVGTVGLDAAGEAWVDFETALFKGQMRIRIKGAQKKVYFNLSKNYKSIKHCMG